VENHGLDEVWNKIFKTSFSGYYIKHSCLFSGLNNQETWHDRLNNPKVTLQKEKKKLFLLYNLY